jgi:hypothetical protein
MGLRSRWNQPDALIQHIIQRKHRKYATNPDNFIQLDYLLERVRRRTRTEVATSRFRSLDTRPPDPRDLLSDGGMGNFIQVPQGNAHGFSSSQEVSDYLPQPYKGTAWDDFDDHAATDGENHADSAGMRHMP